MDMFCFQCQETLKNEGCMSASRCGKTPDVACLQDMLVYVLKGISVWAEKARPLGVTDEEADVFVMEGLFATVTNVNFDAERFMTYIARAFDLRDRYQKKFLEAYQTKHGEFTEDMPECATFYLEPNQAAYIQKGFDVGVLGTADDDVRSLRELLTYGIKGVAAYADHAYLLDYKNDNVLAFIEKGLAATVDDSLTVNELIGLVLECGKISVETLALLDEANTATYGTPEITEVYTGVDSKPAILVSGHDLRDLAELLEQTKDKGVNVYTHGEMLPCNAYPELKKYNHLAGNFGTGWYNQDLDFLKFKGAILMTTNCLTPPKDEYMNRLFTTGMVGWEGLHHIPDRNGGQKDFSPVIDKALEIGEIPTIEGEKRVIGFNHRTILSLADKVVDAVQSGAVKRFVVMAGCDGRRKEREYYTHVAENLPQDTIILTAGCAKYRYNHLDLGDIGGIPRIIDAGQCNDSYSLAVVALKLKEAFGLDDINDLPISYDIAWYEQKAVCVLLALLYLGVKGIRLGPTLPAFLSPNVAQVLVDKFNIKPIGTVEDDISAMMAGA